MPPRLPVPLDEQPKAKYFCSGYLLPSQEDSGLRELNQRRERHCLQAVLYLQQSKPRCQTNNEQARAMKKKSKYKPRGVRYDNLSWILAGMKKVGSLPTAGVALKLKNREALDSILTGHGTKDHVDVLISAVNMSEALIRIRDELGIDWKDEIKAAQDAIYTMGKRGIERERFAFTGPEMTAVKLVMNLHDAQLDDCSVKDMEQALFIVQEEIRLKKCRAIVSAC